MHVSEATSSEKLVWLHSDFAYPLELSKAVLACETIKVDHGQQARLVLVDLKLSFPSLGDKGDEELLVDTEEPKKLESTYVSFPTMER